MKTCFSERKLMKQFGNPSLSKRTLPPPLSTNPIFLRSFFMAPLFVQISKTRTPPPPQFQGEWGTMNKQASIVFSLFSQCGHISDTGKHLLFNEILFAYNAFTFVCALHSFAQPNYSFYMISEKELKRNFEKILWPPWRIVFTYLKVINSLQGIGRPLVVLFL